MVGLIILAFIAIVLFIATHIVERSRIYRILFGGTDESDDGQILFIGRNELIIPAKLVEEGILRVVWTDSLSYKQCKQLLGNMQMFSWRKRNQILSGKCVGNISNPNIDLIEKINAILPR